MDKKERAYRRGFKKWEKAVMGSVQAWRNYYRYKEKNKNA